VYWIALIAGLSLGVPDSAIGTSPDWAVSQDEPEPGTPFAAWLTIHVGSASVSPVAARGNIPRDTVRGAMHHISVTLANSDAAAMWVRGPGQGCDDSRGDSAWSGAVTQDTVLAVCATALRRQDLRLVAVVLDSSSHGVAASVATSEVVRARQPWYDPGPALMGILTAVFGFLTGLGTTFIQRWWERRQAKDDAKKAEVAASAAHVLDMEAKVVQAIGHEWVENKEKLRRFVDSTTVPPDALFVSGYGTLLANRGGVLGYLKEPSRDQYLQHIQAAYKEISDYNDAFQEWRTTPTAETEAALRTSAERVLAQYATVP
jgi:hypothetical protein